jgi:exopolysaccharide biosynthesis protein
MQRYSPPVNQSTNQPTELCNMKKSGALFFLASFFLLPSYNAFGQATDSLAFTKNAFVRKKIGPGLEWQSRHFSQKELFGSNQNINILEVKRKNRRLRLGFAAAGDSLLQTNGLARHVGAVAAINGGFFDIKNGGAVDFLKINGLVIDTTRLSKTKRSEHSMAALVLRRNKLSILKGDSSNQKWDEALPYPDVLTTGPLLVWKNKPVPLSKSAFNDNRHPRTCVCLARRNKLILLTADGRTPEAQGLSLHELARMLRWIGCKTAVNLDGGGSTTMYVAGEPEQGVVNMPCDNKKFDHAGERRVHNIVYIKRRR